MRLARRPDYVADRDRRTHGLALKVRDAIRDPQDVLLCYYVGHGMRNADGKLAPALSETDPDPEVVPDRDPRHRLAHTCKVPGGCQARDPRLLPR